MTISFTGDHMRDVMAQIKEFLFGETAAETPTQEPEPTPAPEQPAEEPHFTVADVRAAFTEAAKLVDRDTIRAALKDISGADSVSAAPERSYAALIAWCKEAVSHAQ